MVTYTIAFGEPDTLAAVSNEDHKRTKTNGASCWKWMKGQKSWSVGCHGEGVLKFSTRWTVLRSPGDLIGQRTKRDNMHGQRNDPGAPQQYSHCELKSSSFWQFSPGWHWNSPSVIFGFHTVLSHLASMWSPLYIYMNYSLNTGKTPIKIIKEGFRKYA